MSYRVDREWGAAFAKLLTLRGVERGDGARNDVSTGATVALVAEELGVSERHVQTAEKHPVFQGREGCLA